MDFVGCNQIVPNRGGDRPMCRPAHFPASHRPLGHGLAPLLLVISVVRGSDAQTVSNVLRGPEGLGHDGQRDIDGPGARQETRVHDIEVLQIVGLAVGIQHRRRRVDAEAERPRRMPGQSGEGTARGQHQPVARLPESSHGKHPQPREGRQVVGLVVDAKTAIRQQRDTVLRVREDLAHGEGEDAMSYGEFREGRKQAREFAPQG